MKRLRLRSAPLIENSVRLGGSEHRFQNCVNISDASVPVGTVSAVQDAICFAYLRAHLLEFLNFLKRT